jgi:hypothetical protein
MNVLVFLPDYVISPNPDLWNVAENGEAFVWTDTNRTAAMSVQVEAVCRPVFRERGGLPSLTAILFLIEAMTTPISLPTAQARVEELFRPVRNTQRDDSKSRIVSWLVSCGHLNADLRMGPARQGALLNDLMESAPQSLFEVQELQAIDATHWLRLSLSDRQLVYFRPQAISEVKSTLAIQTLLHFANSPVNDVSVRLRMQTGLDELPTEIETALPPAKQYSQLLNNLRDDEELGQLIQMAANAASTVSLPRRPSDPDELQVGGVSDITNRGQPERLLATELAADPDLLMARIAHGQALYLRRESPPQNKTLRRRVLIENGVRVWGLARLRATAFALAVAACEERCRGPQLDVFTIAGGSSWSDDLSTRDGLVAQLARLEPDAHPGIALMRLAASWEMDSEEFAEPLLIVSRNTHLDPDFRKCLIDFPSPFLLARIDKDGLVELLQCTRAGEDVFHRQRMVLPVKKLLSAKEPSDELPLLLRQTPCPLRFSSDLSVRWAYLSEGPTLWTMTHNHRLMCFDTAGVGAIEITSLPGEILACSATTNILLVVAEPIPGTQQVRHLLFRASRFGDVCVIKLDTSVGGSQSVRFEFDEQLLRIGREITIFDIESGKILAMEPEPLGMRRHLGGRFFYADHRVWALMYNNDKVTWHQLNETRFEPSFAVQGAHGYPLVYSKDFSKVQVLDGDNNEPLATGAYIDSDEQPKLLLRNLADLSVIIEFERINKSLTSGSTVARRDQLRHWFKLDYRKISEVNNTYAAVWYALDNRTQKLVTSQSVRNRMQGIAVVDGFVVLFRNSSLGFAFEIADSPRRIVLRQFKSTSKFSVVNFDREFKVENSPFRHQWTLKNAVLPQGDAWLDSRGLLHLRARDGSELSLVLHDNHVSGWHSNGSVFGTQYFINRPETPVPASVEAWLKGFANQC